MRWQITEPKRRIATERMAGHREQLEMSGESASLIVSYRVSEEGVLSLGRTAVFPMLRCQPNDTFGSLQKEIDGVLLTADGEEFFDRAEIDGILTLYTHTERAELIHRFFPSVTEPIVYEEITLRAKAPLIPAFASEGRIATVLACEGYVYLDAVCDSTPQGLQSGEEAVYTFAISAYFADQARPREERALARRHARVEELMRTCDLTTGDAVIDTAFAFAKLRAGESLFRTPKGLIHCPGGGTYYAAVWCNDQCEYSSPFFALLGDPKAWEAAETAYAWYEPYMNDEYLPLPSSIISCGRDYWNGVGDRGDAAMYLFGLATSLLLRGQKPTARQETALTWCVTYLQRRMTAEDVVASDTDELEGRLSSGINLNTSSLAYGGLVAVATLWRRVGEREKAAEAEALASRLRAGIEGYFGGEVGGYRTYHYHRGCEKLRAWLCLPIYMGIHDRAEETLRAIGEQLWYKGSCRSTEGEAIVWDRSAMYFFMSLFRFGDGKTGEEKLREFSRNRLLGDRVPYPVEAWPEGNMRHLSAESALYCRVITDGLLQVQVTEEGPRLSPTLLSGCEELRLNRVYLDGAYRDLRVFREKETVSYEILPSQS